MKSLRFSDGSADQTNGTLKEVLSAVVGRHGAPCGLLIHWENKVLFMALLSQIHIFLNVPNLYWTWHWVNLCYATLGISKRTEYVFPRDFDRFDSFLDSSWVWFTIRSFTDTGTAKYWMKRHKQKKIYPKIIDSNTLLCMPILSLTVHRCAVILKCPEVKCFDALFQSCTHRSIGKMGIWCQASTRTGILAFTLVEISWMDALVKKSTLEQTFIVYIFTPLCLSKSVFFFFHQSSLFCAYDFKKAIKQSWHK